MPLLQKLLNSLGPMGTVIYVVVILFTGILVSLSTIFITHWDNFIDDYLSLTY